MKKTNLLINVNGGGGVIPSISKKKKEDGPRFSGV